MHPVSSHPGHPSFSFSSSGWLLGASRSSTLSRCHSQELSPLPDTSESASSPPWIISHHLFWEQNACTVGHGVSGRCNHFAYTTCFSWCQKVQATHMGGLKTTFSDERTSHWTSHVKWTQTHVKEGLLAFTGITDAAANITSCVMSKNPQPLSLPPKLSFLMGKAEIMPHILIISLNYGKYQIK